MSARILITDETSTGKLIRELTLELLTPSVTARQLIELRVRDEVARYNQDASLEVFRGLIQPSDTEALLNSADFKHRSRKHVDVEAQCTAALRAFESNGFLLLVGDRQIESLAEPIRVTPDLRVTFVKLVPLVGG